MRSIQEVGTEILTHKPKKFYIFAGSEYGIKQRYISELTDCYHNKIECNSVDEILTIMSVKHLVPLVPALYVVRYDETFISSLNDHTAYIISKSKICGTIVCIYDNPKIIDKLDKFVGDYSVLIGEINKHTLAKYLSSQYKLSDIMIANVCNVCSDYSDAMNICNAISRIDKQLSESDISFIFGKQLSVNDDMIKLGVAAKDFKYLINLFDKYLDTADAFIYCMMSAVVDIDKIKSSKYSDSNLAKFAKMWKPSDMCNFFNACYISLLSIRSSNVDPNNSVIYLLALLQFESIPDMEVM